MKINAPSSRALNLPREYYQFFHDVAGAVNGSASQGDITDISQRLVALESSGILTGAETLSYLSAEVSNASINADSSNAQLAEIASDGKLTPAEKKIVVRDYTVITTEQGGIDSQASAYGITTEKTTYDNAISALTVYLNSLTTATAWNDITGNTDVVGLTFRSKFSDVYTARQSLLNAIYAVAKAKTDAAQSSADKNTNAQSVTNPKFDGSTDGWSFTNSEGSIASSEFYSETGSKGFPGNATYLVHQGQSGQTWARASNAAQNPVTPGQVVSVTAAVRDAGTAGSPGVAASPSANSTAYVRSMIEWMDDTGAVIDRTYGTPTGGNGGTYFQCNSKASGPAPANATAARAGLEFDDHTSGYLNASVVQYSAQPDNLDAVPNSGTRKAVSSVDPNNRALIDFSQGHLNPKLAYIADDATSGRYAVSNIDGNRRALVDFTQGAHIGKNLDNIGDGGTYVRAMAVMANGKSVPIPNNDFSLGSGTNIPGWSLQTSGGNWYIDGSNPAPGYAQDASIKTPSGSACEVHSTYRFRVKPGQSIAMKALLRAPNGVATKFFIDFLDKNGAYCGGLACQTTSTSYVDLVNATTVPSNAVSAFVGCYVATSGGSPYGAFQHVDVCIDDVTARGSGAQLGDYRNMPQSQTLGFGGVRSGTPATADSSGNVSINAHNVQLGTVNTPYAAKSNAVTGLTPGVKYNVYTTDGGTSWNATTNAQTANSFDSSLYAFQITVPTSGTSGGGTNPKLL